MDHAPLKILCLFVRHGSERYPEALSTLDDWYVRHGLMGQRTLWIIDNSLPAETAPRRLGPETLLLAGDNRAWEFSAWSRALREARTAAIQFDLVHFVTSSFNTLYTRYLDHFQRDMLHYVHTRQVCLGHIDSYDRPVEFAGHRSAAWIRTCFFFLSAPLARKVEPWAAFTDRTPLFATPTTTAFRPGAPLSEDYQRRIRIWLEGQEVGGHTWHSPILPGQKEVDRFQHKTVAILNEHSLAVTLRNLPVRLVDYCWLWSHLNQTEVIAQEPPEESAQLVVRRRVLGILP